MEKRIDDLIAQVRAMPATGSRAQYFRTIISLLQDFRANVRADKHVRHRLSSGLGRIVLDDYSFAETELGGQLCMLCDDFAE